MQLVRFALEEWSNTDPVAFYMAPNSSFGKVLGSILGWEIMIFSTAYSWRSAKLALMSRESHESQRLVTTMRIPKILYVLLCTCVVVSFLLSSGSSFQPMCHLSFQEPLNLRRRWCHCTCVFGLDKSVLVRRFPSRVIKLFTYMNTTLHMPQLAVVLIFLLFPIAFGEASHGWVQIYLTHEIPTQHIGYAFQEVWSHSAYTGSQHPEGCRIAGG